MTNTMSTSALSKKPLDPHLFSGPQGTADDVRVQTGYPVWNLIELWRTSGENDDEVLAGYSDMPHEEWEAAKCYYLEHKPFIDARIIANSQPAADDDVPPMQTADDYFAWLATRDDDRETSSDTPNGAR
jgi:uncharacterized protein (DUF433 family)